MDLNESWEKRMVFSKVPHLGGYLRGGDCSTYCEPAFQWIMDQLKPQSLIDVGCGEGHQVKWFADHGVVAHGVDGAAEVVSTYVGPSGSFIQHDYTLGVLELHRTYSLALSLEFVEHVHEAYMSHYLDTFRLASWLIMTHAQPGQVGHHHVNCQSTDYWRKILSQQDFIFNRDLTKQLRARSGGTFLGTTGLVFQNPTPRCTDESTLISVGA